MHAKVDRVRDRATLYLSMLYPVLYGHAQPARPFAWFVQGGFVVPPLEGPLLHSRQDGFVWRVRSENPMLRRELESA